MPNSPVARPSSPFLRRAVAAPPAGARGGGRRRPHDREPRAAWDIDPERLPEGVTLRIVADALEEAVIEAGLRMVSLLGLEQGAVTLEIAPPGASDTGRPPRFEIFVSEARAEDWRDRLRWRD